MGEGLGEWDGEPAPDDDRAEAETAEREAAPELFYANVAEFVRGILAVTYRRRIDVGAGTTWCPKWWKHAEAISRLEALWRAWEHLRLDGTTGMSVWWRDHADHRMGILLSADGPFKGCSPDDGHRTKLGPPALRGTPGRALLTTAPDRRPARLPCPSAIGAYRERMDTEQEPAVLQGQTSIEDLLDDSTPLGDGAHPMPGCLPGLEELWLPFRSRPCARDLVQGRSVVRGCGSVR